MSGSAGHHGSHMHSAKRSARGVRLAESAGLCPHR
jgi:hypothetical protein